MSRPFFLMMLCVWHVTHMHAMDYVKSLYAWLNIGSPTQQEVDAIKARERSQDEVINYASYDAALGMQNKLLLRCSGKLLACSSLAASATNPDTHAFFSLATPQPSIQCYQDTQKLFSMPSSMTNGHELCFSKDDQFLAQTFQSCEFPDYSDSVYVYSSSNKKNQVIKQHFISRLRWNRALGKNLLAVICASAPKHIGPHNVRIYEVQPNYVQKMSECEHDAAASGWACRWHPIQNIVQVARNNDDATFALIRASSGKTIGSVKMDQYLVDDSCFSDDGAGIAISAQTLGGSKALSVYEVKTLKEKICIPLKEALLIAGWHHQGILVQAKKQSEVHMVDVRSGYTVRSFEGPSLFGVAQLSKTALSPDGTKLFMATSDAMKIVDVGSGRLLKEYCRDGQDFAMVNPTWNCDSSAVLYTTLGLMANRIEKQSIVDCSGYNPAL